MAKILVVGNPLSSFVQENGLVGQQMGHQVHWFSRHSANLPGVKHHTFPQWAKKHNAFRAVIEPIQLSLTLQKIKPDLVHVIYASLGLAALPLSRQHPLLVTAMGSDVPPGKGYVFPYRSWTRLLLKRADAITVRTEFMREKLATIGVSRERMHRLYWGIDLDVFNTLESKKSLRKKWKLPDEMFVFFDPRSATPLYNKDVVIKAFAKTAQGKNGKTVLLSASNFADASYLERLKQLAGGLGISDQVVFLERVELREMAELYNLADVTLSVPSSDGLPQTLFEAWGCGSFVILSDLPYLKELISEDVIVKLVPVGDAGKLAEAMIWAWEHPEIRDAARVKGIEFVRKHADKRIEADALKKIYSRLLGQ